MRQYKLLVVVTRYHAAMVGDAMVHDYGAWTAGDDTGVYPNYWDRCMNH